jgi:putative FmdB family regulatory protein
MPFYEYECNDCGSRHEALQKMSDPALTDCPACGGPELRKLVSAAGFRLKGGGWYETDFKGTKKKNVAETAPSSSGDSTACSPTGCAKPGCAAGPDAST